MNRLRVLVALAVVSGWLALMLPVPALAEEMETVLPPSLVTAPILEAKIAETEAAADLAEEAKTKLVELYRKALSNLQTARAHAEAADTYRRAAQDAPAQIRALRDDPDKGNVPSALETLPADISTPLREIEQLLLKEQADLAAVDALRADLERRLTYHQARPAAITERLPQARRKQEEIASQMMRPTPGDEGAALREARRWVLETRYAALSREIEMLDQELLSQPLRIELLEAQRDKQLASIEWIRTRVAALGDLLNRKRQRDAERDHLAAEQTRLDTEGLDPVLTRLSELNAALTQEVNVLAARLDGLDRQQTQAEALARRIAADFADAQATLASSGLAPGLGRVLLEQRESLPDLHAYRFKDRIREQHMAEIGVRRLRHQAETRAIADLEQTVAGLEAKLEAEPTPQLRGTLRQLVEQRQRLLEKALETDELYLGELRELDAVERKLLDAAGAYDAFLREHLIWLRTAEPTRLQDLLTLPEEARQLLTAVARVALTGALIDQVVPTATFWLALLLAAVLLWKRRTLIVAIEGAAKRVRRPSTDRFSDTLRALGATFLVAAPWPLLLLGVGEPLQAAAQGTESSHAIGVSLSRIAFHLYVLRALHAMCAPGGLAAAHFRWPEPSLRLLRVELDRFTWLFVPAVLLVRLAMDLNPIEAAGTIARLGSLVLFGALAVFFYRVFHPKRGVLAPLRARDERGLIFRTYSLWYPLLVVYPLTLAGLALTGYLYSATALTFMLLHTLWLILGLVVINALALRWLRVVRRRLAYEAALERRQAALATGQSGEQATGGDETAALQFEEPEADLAALSDDSRDLVKIAVIVAGALGVYLIWSPILPALRIFEDVTLWYHAVTVDGTDTRLPITLADLGLALIYAIGTGLLATRLPALLEIILLRRFDMSSGSRYTVTTLTTYAIVAVGILLVLHTIGAQWSQLQWLVAALGVGIGFGLQEIVANFISGLIILFERPIRVGDIVSVGDTDGVVTRIRIRATTIRNWDRKELLVPNKEFITGRLLNWTLSDQVTRITIVVGVAYGSDVDKALALMKEAAAEQPHILDDPAPILTFEGFGDNALTLVLRAFIDSIDYRLSTTTDLHRAINRKLAAAGITIAFPQRDLHLDAKGPLRVSIEDHRHRAADVPSGTDAARARPQE